MFCDLKPSEENLEKPSYDAQGKNLYATQKRQTKV